MLEVYRDTASVNFALTADELDCHGNAIDKVRAGFVLEEICAICSPRINEWLKYKQRGGSRKLDAEAVYSPNFSSRWDLSINTMFPEPRREPSAG